MKKEMSRHAGAAKMVRAYMKANGIAGSVKSSTYSMGSSINVHVVDMSPAVVKDLESYVSQFEYGHFDGMEDIYEMSNVRDDIPQVKYAFVNNIFSDELAQKIYDFAKGYFAGMEDAPVDYKESYKFYNKAFDRYANQLVGQLFRGGQYNQYYDFINGVEEEMMA